MIIHGIDLRSDMILQKSVTILTSDISTWDCMNYETKNNLQAKFAIKIHMISTVLFKKTQTSENFLRSNRSGL